MARTTKIPVWWNAKVDEPTGSEGQRQRFLLADRLGGLVIITYNPAAICQPLHELEVAPTGTASDVLQHSAQLILGTPSIKQGRVSAVPSHVQLCRVPELPVVFHSRLGLDLHCTSALSVTSWPANAAAHDCIAWPECDIADMGCSMSALTICRQMTSAC